MRNFDYNYEISTFEKAKEIEKLVEKNQELEKENKELKDKINFSKINYIDKTEFQNTILKKALINACYDLYNLCLSSEYCGAEEMIINYILEAGKE